MVALIPLRRKAQGNRKGIFSAGVKCRPERLRSGAANQRRIMPILKHGLAHSQEEKANQPRKSAASGYRRGFGPTGEEALLHTAVNWGGAGGEGVCRGGGLSLNHARAGTLPIPTKEPLPALRRPSSRHQASLSATERGKALL